jgi:hypothetical protein
LDSAFAAACSIIEVVLLAAVLLAAAEVASSYMKSTLLQCFSHFHCARTALPVCAAYAIRALAAALQTAACLSLKVE